MAPDHLPAVPPPYLAAAVLKFRNDLGAAARDAIAALTTALAPDHLPAHVCDAPPAGVAGRAPAERIAAEFHTAWMRFSLPRVGGATAGWEALPEAVRADLSAAVQLLLATDVIRPGRRAFVPMSGEPATDEPDPAPVAVPAGTWLTAEQFHQAALTTALAGPDPVTSAGVEHLSRPDGCVCVAHADSDEWFTPPGGCAMHEYRRTDLTLPAPDGCVCFQVHVTSPLPGLRWFAPPNGCPAHHRWRRRTIPGRVVGGGTVTLYPTRDLRTCRCEPWHGLTGRTMRTVPRDGCPAHPNRAPGDTWPEDTDG